MDLWTQINKTIDETIDNLTVSLIALDRLKITVTTVK
jgi:hypothetical protein